MEDGVNTPAPWLSRVGVEYLRQQFPLRLAEPVLYEVREWY